MVHSLLDAVSWLFTYVKSHVCFLITILCCVLVQYCTGCAKNQDSQKQLFLATPPNVLILHLKRFDVLNDTKV